MSKIVAAKKDKVLEAKQSLKAALISNYNQIIQNQLLSKQALISRLSGLATIQNKFYPGKTAEHSTEVKNRTVHSLEQFLFPHQTSDVSRIQLVKLLLQATSDKKVLLLKAREIAALCHFLPGGSLLIARISKIQDACLRSLIADKTQYCRHRKVSEGDNDNGSIELDKLIHFLNTNPSGGSTTTCSESLQHNDECQGGEENTVHNKSPKNQKQSLDIAELIKQIKIFFMDGLGEKSIPENKEVLACYYLFQTLSALRINLSANVTGYLCEMLWFCNQRKISVKINVKNLAVKVLETIEASLNNNLSAEKILWCYLIIIRSYYYQQQVQRDNLTLTIKYSRFLSSNLKVLLSVNSACFDSSEGFQNYQTALVEELSVLRDGAATLGVYDIEEWADLLIVTHDIASHFPEHCNHDVLKDLEIGHEQLKVMLNQAAAWGQIKIKENIKQRLLTRQRAVNIALLSNKPVNRNSSVRDLKVFTRQLSQLLDIPISLSVNIPMGESTIEQISKEKIIDAIKMLMRFTLSGRCGSIEERRVTGKTQAIIFKVKIQQTDSLYSVKLQDNGKSENLSQVSLARLSLSTASSLLHKQTLTGNLYQWQFDDS